MKKRNQSNEGINEREKKGKKEEKKRERENGVGGYNQKIP